MTQSEDIRFGRPTEVELADLVAHMSEPRLREHMPLLKGPWGETEARAFVAAKESCWERDGLGHWALFEGGRYVGWGGFQKEGDEWDFGLVLRPQDFGLGTRITRQALEFARRNPGIPHVTFLLPPSRRKLAVLRRLGARACDPVQYAGATFLKFRIETAG